MAAAPAEQTPEIVALCNDLKMYYEHTHEITPATAILQQQQYRRVKNSSTVLQ